MLLLSVGVLTAEKDRVFLGVATWLRDKDRELEVDCCFLLRTVLGQQRYDTELQGLLHAHEYDRDVFRALKL